MFGRKRTPSTVKVVVYRDVEGRWRWRAAATVNAKILAMSSEAYNDVRDAQQAIRALWPDGVEVEQR